MNIEKILYFNKIKDFEELKNKYPENAGYYKNRIEELEKIINK